MESIDAAGLNRESVGTMAKRLNELLANYAIFYQNVRGYHWRIKDDRFSAMPLKFEELCMRLQLNMDGLAERILTLGHSPILHYSEYKSLSTVPESDTISDGLTAVSDILLSFGVLITLQYNLHTLAGDTRDEVTCALMGEFIWESEKLAWVYAAYLNN